MKKLIIFTLFILITSLTACAKEPVIDDIIEDIPCTDVQIEVDGECINLTGPQIQLREVLNNTKDLSNYELLVTITENDIEFEIIMMFDDDKSSIQTLNQIDYYINRFGVCSHTTIMNEVITTTSLDCFTDDTYLFFKDFDYTWFTVVEGRYALNQENYSEIEAFFAEGFPNSTLESFTMSTTQLYIADMIIELLIDDVAYTIELDISSIDQINIDLPGEE